MSYHTMRPGMSSTTPRKSAGNNKGTPSKKPATPSPNKATKPRPKQEWNTYLTDDDRFKITKDELVRRKQMMISKHNILQDFEQPLSTPSKTYNKSPSSISKAALTPKQDVTSLDLLLESDDMVSEGEPSIPQQQEGAVVAPKKGKKKTAVSITKTKKAKEEAAAMQKRQDMIAEVMASNYSDYSQDDDDNDEEEDDEDFAYQLPKHFTPSSASKPRNAKSYSVSPKRKPNMDRTTSPRGSMTSSVQSRRVGHTSSSFLAVEDRLGDRDVQDMAVEIKLLLQEMKYYEELSGNKKIFDAEELEALVEDDVFEEQLDQKRVIKFLVQLVCQSMTHLLKSAVEHQNLQSQIDLLMAKFDEMSTFMGMHKTNNHHNSTANNRYLTPQQAQANPNAIDAAITPQAPPSINSINNNNNNNSTTTTTMKTPGSPNGRLFPTSYVNPYESYFSDDTPPPPPTDDDAITSSVDHWIEYSKRVGEQEASQAFSAMQMVTSSTQRATSAYAHNNMPGFAQQAAQELDQHQQLHNAGFTGTSPTDLLFAPSALTNTSSSRMKEKQTPASDYMSAADMAAKTYDLYAAKFAEKKSSAVSTAAAQVHVVQDVDDDEDRITDSYDAMIERLSYKFATTVKPSQPSVVKTTMTSPEVISKGKISLGLRREEQGTIVIPNGDVPTPLQAPLHPFSARMTADDYSQKHFQSDVFDTSKQLFPASPQRRIYDASLGSF